MTKEARNPKFRIHARQPLARAGDFVIGNSDLFRHLIFVIRHFASRQLSLELEKP
jgi:hypothetical protein